MIRAYSAEDGIERLSLSVKKKLGCFAVYLTEEWISCGLPLPHNIPYGIMEQELAVDGCMYYHKSVGDQLDMANTYVYNLCLELIRLQRMSRNTRFYMLGSHNEVINYVNLLLGPMGIMYSIHRSQFHIDSEEFGDLFNRARTLGDRLQELTGRKLNLLPVSVDKDAQRGEK